MKMSQMKFHEVADCWLQNAIIGLSYSWKTQIISTVKHLNRGIGDKQIDEIKPMDIERLIKSLSVMNPNTKKPASKRLLKAVSNTANQIYVFAIENEITNKNPASGLIKKIPKNAPTKLVEALTDYQKSIVMEVDHPLKLAAVIMMFMGPVGMGIAPPQYFGIFERFSTFSAVGYNAILGIYLFNKFGLKEVEE